MLQHAASRSRQSQPPLLAPRPPSTITQYEYYSPLSPDGVPKIFGTPPRIVFLHTGFPGLPLKFITDLP